MLSSVRPVGFALLFEQVVAGDFELFQLGVAVQAQDFHAVLERGRDGVEDVGGGDEEDFGEIVVDVEVVVLEGGVLLGVEDFEERRGRVAAEVVRPSCRLRRGGRRGSWCRPSSWTG